MRTRMRISQRAAVAMIAASLLALAACGGGATGAGSGTPAATAAIAATATATPKPKPSGAPAITTASCQTLMTLDEANKIMSPPAPATALQAGSSDNFGVCNYMTASNTLVLKIFLETYTGPVPVPQATLQGLLSRLAQDNAVTINKATNVSGVGDQAAYLEVTASPGGGYTLVAHVFYTIYGKVIFGCLTYTLNGVGQSGSQSQLQQCAEQVVSRL